MFRTISSALGASKIAVENCCTSAEEYNSDNSRKITKSFKQTKKQLFDYETQYKTR
jgi:hypothetical protein